MLKTFWTLGWLTWWAFLGAKLSGAWAHVSWWVITAPLDFVAAIGFILLSLFAVVGAGTALALSKGGGEDIKNAFKRLG
jgi:hypothetical protein